MRGYFQLDKGAFFAKFALVQNLILIWEEHSNLEKREK